LRHFWIWYFGAINASNCFKEETHVRPRPKSSPPQTRNRLELTTLWETLPLSERQETLQTLTRLLAQELQSLNDKQVEVQNEHLA